MYLQNRRTNNKVHIFSYSAEPFQNRTQAGELLGQEMSSFKGKKAVVLGIPRGGIIIAQGLARSIEAELDIILSRKLGAPNQPELAIGALAEDGEVFLNQYVVRELGVTNVYIEQERDRQMAEIERRRQMIRSVRPKVPLNGRIVIVTDDGVATGATIQAAVWALRQEKPQKLIAAVPVASEEAVTRLAEDTDEIFCLRLPSYFMAVGQFYTEFNQVTDDEVLDILRKMQTG